MKSSTASSTVISTLLTNKSSYDVAINYKSAVFKMQPVIYQVGTLRECIWGMGWKLAKLPNNQIEQNSAETIRSQIEAHPELEISWGKLSEISKAIRWHHEAFAEDKDALPWEYLKATVGGAKVVSVEGTKLLEDPKDPTNRLSAVGIVHIFTTYFFYPGFEHPGFEVPRDVRDGFEEWLQGWVERWIEHLHEEASLRSEVERKLLYQEATKPLPTEDLKRIADGFRKWFPSKSVIS